MPENIGENRWNILAELILRNNYKTFVEVGVYEGNTSRYLLGRFPELHIYAVDPYKHYSGYATANLSRAKDIATDVLHHDRVLWVKEFSIDAASRFDEESLDIVFIDANHKYGYVKEDLQAWWPKVRRGGIMSGHDFYSWAKNEGVRRAVQRFAKSRGLKINRGYDAVWWIIKE